MRKHKPKEKRGIFIVFEGIDGSGTTTQRDLLVDYITKFTKGRIGVHPTLEPWKNEEIRKKLREDKDAYSDGEEMAELYIDDRELHTKREIRPTLKKGKFVLCDRYKMSTCAYQQTQGVQLENLLALHEDRGLLTPDITYFIDVEHEVAARRLQKNRESLEKFEKDPKFVEQLIKNYRNLRDLAKKDWDIFGQVDTINGNQPIEKVATDIRNSFLPLYTVVWESSNFK